MSSYRMQLIQLQRRKLGDDVIDGPEAIEHAPIHGALANVSSDLVRAVVSRPDGLVREVKTKTVVSREEIDERLETEDVKFLGDFSDEVSAKQKFNQISNRKPPRFKNHKPNTKIYRTTKSFYNQAITRKPQNQKQFCRVQNIFYNLLIRLNVTIITTKTKL